jgi:hypothetical protein
MNHVMLVKAWLADVNAYLNDMECFIERAYQDKYDSYRELWYLRNGKGGAEPTPVLVVSPRNLSRQCLFNHDITF